MTLAEIRDSVLVKGPGSGSEGWDKEWRAKLVDNLEILAKQLWWEAGNEEIYINGSFVEDKLHPNDIDGYFVCDEETWASGELKRKLNALDEDKIWDWSAGSRKRYRGYPKKQLRMWRKYRMDLYPHIGQGTGVLDANGNEMEFPALFRAVRSTGKEKGIVKLVRRSES